MIPMNKNKIKYVVGDSRMEVRPLPVYSPESCSFLDELSKVLRGDREAKGFPDIMAFAFWCRKGNILRLREAYPFCGNRLGRGLAFHIAPSNVPVNFAYSLAFGLLAGNANVVRVSEKEFRQTDILCRGLREVLQRPEHRLLAEQTQVVSYGHDRKINDFYSSQCDVRVIWGGDAAIREIRKSELRLRATEITFADRYSFALLDQGAVAALSEGQLADLAEKFYNDTYLMDQNACSSPHLIFWTNAAGNEDVRMDASENGDAGRNAIGNEVSGMHAVRKRFWDAVHRAAEKYELPEKKVMDKYTLLCENAASGQGKGFLQRYGNLLYVVTLQELPGQMEELRGKFGLFYEMELGSFEEICHRLSQRVQTCVTFGVSQEMLAQCLVDHHVRGVDRIVPVGQAMDIGVYWDGYDVIGNLSRGLVV